jgi:hypothetical protein
MPIPKSTRRPRTSAKPAAANPARGEHSITLGGIGYVLRPTAAASFAVEEELGLSLLEVFRACNAMALSYAQIGVVLAHYIRAGAAPDDQMTRAVSSERLAELVYEDGVAIAFAMLTLLLADAIGGGRTSSGEAKAVARI